MKLYLKFIVVHNDRGEVGEEVLHYWDENVKQWVAVDSEGCHEDYYEKFITLPPTN